MNTATLKQTICWVIAEHSPHEAAIRRSGAYKALSSSLSLYPSSSGPGPTRLATRLAGFDRKESIVYLVSIGWAREGQSPKTMAFNTFSSTDLAKLARQLHQISTRCQNPALFRPICSSSGHSVD